MILITGATGTNGREIVKQLSAAGIPARALVRNEKGAASVSLPKIETVIGDFTQTASLESALKGVERVLLLTPFLPNQVELQCGFIEIAKRAGVKQIVKFSVFGADAESRVGIFRQHGQIEQELEHSGLGFTHLRPNSFMQNFLASAATIARGAIYAPAGDGRVSFVDARDIAAVALKALTEPGHEGKTYEVTGPEALTHAQAATQIGAAIGKTVAYVDVTPEQYKGSLAQYGVPAWMADGLNDLYAAYKTGAAARVTDTVARIAGKPPIPFAQFAKEHTSALKGA